MSDRTSAKEGFILLGILMVANALIGAFAWPYTIESWAHNVAGNPNVQIAGWQGALLGFVPYLGNVTVPAAVVTWIAMLIVRGGS